LIPSIQPIIGEHHEMVMGEAGWGAGPAWMDACLLAGIMKR